MPPLVQGSTARRGPSAIPFSDDHPIPVALDSAGIERVVQAFEGAARRALAAGFQVIEIVPRARIPVEHGYQVPFARRIRAEADVMTGAVGLITAPDHANEVITSGDADLVLLGRELLREPYWALAAQHALEQEPALPVPYGYAVKRRIR